MSELIFNALPLTQEERARFTAAAPGVEQRFVPLMDNSGLTVPLSDPSLVEGATVVLGSLPADVLSASPTLKWLQTWSAGVDVYLKPAPCLTAPCSPPPWEPTVPRWPSTSLPASWPC